LKSKNLAADEKMSKLAWFLWSVLSDMQYITMDVGQEWVLPIHAVE
jgi:hypothetical protein